MFGRTFVLLSVLVVGTGNPAFALKAGGGGFSPQCPVGESQQCSSGPPPVCRCVAAAKPKKSSVTPTRQGSGITSNGTVNTGNKGTPSSGKKH